MSQVHTLECTNRPISSSCQRYPTLLGFSRWSIHWLMNIAESRAFRAARCHGAAIRSFFTAKKTLSSWGAARRSKLRSNMPNVEMGDHLPVFADVLSSTSGPSAERDWNLAFGSRDIIESEFVSRDGLDVLMGSVLSCCVKKNKFHSRSRPQNCFSAKMFNKLRWASPRLRGILRLQVPFPLLLVLSLLLCLFFGSC